MVSATKRTVNGLELQIVRDYGQLSRIAADHILGRVKETPNLNMLVPTGTTPERVYSMLSEEAQALQGVTMFNMDEYCQEQGDGTYRFLAQDDPTSYRAYMRLRLLDQVS